MLWIQHNDVCRNCSLQVCIYPGGPITGQLNTTFLHFRLSLTKRRIGSQVLRCHRMFLIQPSQLKIYEISHFLRLESHRSLVSATIPF
jgi:hypothetical protein